MRELSILGATGSIGTSALDVVRRNRDRFDVIGLSCHSNIELLANQVREFSPRVVSVGPGKTGELKSLLSNLSSPPDILEDTQGHIEVASLPTNGLVVAAMVGSAGIKPVMAAIASGNTIGLANKESLVLSGSVLIRQARKHKVKILPIDSEHNAIFQSLKDEPKSALDFITLTASGGPFLNKPFEEFDRITVKDALNHPNWDMGSKVTIDSATLMNKCLEIIEAKWLFDLDPEQIRVVIHPQSIIHSMVTFIDGSTICQMGVPDMRTPISYCLGFPDRIYSGSATLSFSQASPLTFFEPDTDKFPTLNLAFESLRLGGGAPAALNGANEILVNQFLEGSIRFTDISATLVQLMADIADIFKTSEDHHLPFLKEIQTIDDALAADQWGREFVRRKPSKNSNLSLS